MGCFPALGHLLELPDSTHQSSNRKACSLPTQYDQGKPLKLAIPGSLLI